MNHHYQTHLDGRSINSSHEIQKLKERRDSLAKRFHDLKASRDTPVNEGADPIPNERRYTFRKMKRSQSTEPTSRRQARTNDSTSSNTILVKAISQLLEKKKEREQEKSFASLEVGGSESKEVYHDTRQEKAIPRRCRSMDRRFLDEDGIPPSIVSSRTTNNSINKAIIQLLEKKQSMDMSISQELHRNQSSKVSSLLLAGYLRKAVPSRVGEWVTMYVQITPGLFTMSDIYGRSKLKICLSTSSVKCRAVHVTDHVRKILSKAGENIHEVAFFEMKSIGTGGGLSRLWMTHTTVERDAWLAAIEEAIIEDESVSDLSSSAEMT